jgi:hypothetical protein
MRLSLAAAVALIFTSSTTAQTISDLSTATPIGGNWSYAPASDGSEAVFANASGYPQLWVHCSRASQQVSIMRSSGAAAPMLNIWTSSATRSVAASFNPATSRLTSEFSNYDPLLDAIATSRARIGVTIGSGPALVIPAWPEVARAIEDCRA